MSMTVRRFHPVARRVVPAAAHDAVVAAEISRPRTRRETQRSPRAGMVATTTTGDHGWSCAVGTYTCLDGPLEGRVLRWRTRPPVGRPVTVALVDVGHGVLEVDYQVQRPAGQLEVGHLRFVAARAPQRRSGWRAWAARLRYL
jgi:hypothetical protein